MFNRRYIRQTLLLALPVALQMLLQSLLGMADVTMVSGLGEEAVASVGLAAKLHFLLMVFMLGISAGGGALIAQFTGARNQRGAQNTLAVTMALGTIINVPLMVLFVVAPWWMPLINPDLGVSNLTAQFLIITAPVLLCTQLTLIYEAALRAIGNMTVPLVIGVITVFLNIFFNYVLIFGHLGFDAHGVMGAAWGTLIARLLQISMIILWVYLNKHSFALKKSQFFESLTKVNIKHFAVFSAPLVINHGLWGLGNTTYHVLMGYAGTDALAIMGVMVPIESAIFSIFLGISSACAVLVGQALGANDVQEARALQRFFTVFTVAASLLCAVLLWLAKPLMLPLFDELSDDALNLMLSAITVFCFVLGTKIFNMLAIVGVLRAGGDNQYCLVTDCVVMWLIGIPIFANAVIFGVPFIWLYALMSLEDVVKMWPYIFRIKKGVWLRNLTEESVLSDGDQKIERTHLHELEPIQVGKQTTCNEQTPNAVVNG